MTFKKACFLAFFSVSVVSVFVVYSQIKIGPLDPSKYETITQQSKTLRSSHSLERNPTYQVRKNTEKDIWKIKGEERVHIQMYAKDSKLSIKQKKDQIFAKEELDQITCLSPLGLLYAKNGLYDYPEENIQINQVECIHELGNIQAAKALFKSNEKTHILSFSEGVKLSASKENHPLMISSQEALCEGLDLKGFSAEKGKKIEFFGQVEIQMMDGFGETQIGILRLENAEERLSTQIVAKGGYAIYNEGSVTLYPEKNETYCHLEEFDHKIDAKKIHFDLACETILCHESKGCLNLEKPLFFSSDELLWEKGEEKISLKDHVKIHEANTFQIDADLANIRLENQVPKYVEISNNVHLFCPSIQNKDSFALADALFIDLENHTLQLSAKAPKRVLFWQEGVSLSAPEILIHKDPVSNEESIQGKGDIRFTFNTEEKNIIDQFISKYL